MSGSRLRIVVQGYIVRGPLGGMCWHHMQYVMGLAALGHDVCFLEDSGDSAGCYDPDRNAMTIDPTYGMNFAGSAFARVGLENRWAFYDAATARWIGPRGADAPGICATADLFLNLSLPDPVRPWMLGIPVRAMMDTDPVFNQVRILNDPAMRAMAKAHNAFFTFGETIGLPGRNFIPDGGFPWQRTRQPVALDFWPVTPGPTSGKWTTVMAWESYKNVEYGGQWYGMKSDSFAPYMDLPHRTAEHLEIALGSPNAPRPKLIDHGWSLVDPLEVARDPWTYQSYMQQSKGEFTVAKHGYVVSRSGWFSERTAAYMASGRPAVVQETGFSDWLPSGTGVIGFNNADEALAGLDEMSRRYELHCRAAREIAAEYFDYRKVLPDLIDRAMASKAAV